MLKADYEAMYNLFKGLAERLGVPTPEHDAARRRMYPAYSMNDLRRLTLAVAEDLATQFDDKDSSSPVAGRIRRARESLQEALEDA